MEQSTIARLAEAMKAARIENLVGIHGVVVNLPAIALTWPTYAGDEDGKHHVWQFIAPDLETARAYYESLDDKARIEEAALALSAGGWDKRKVCHRMS